MLEIPDFFHVIPNQTILIPIFKTLLGELFRNTFTLGLSDYFLFLLLEADDSTEVCLFHFPATSPTGLRNDLRTP